jgi:general secretion pathway protein C
MWARWVTFLLWAAVAASVVAWGLQLFVTAPAAPRGAVVADASLALRGDVTRVLGVDAPPAASPEAEAAPATDARFQLVGVVAPRSAAAGAREGVALIAVDGKPARAYRVGAVVEAPDLILKRVGARAAELARRDGGPSIALEIPPLPPPATGTLPGADGSGDAAAGVAPAPPPVAAPGFPRPGAAGFTGRPGVAAPAMPPPPVVAPPPPVAPMQPPVLQPGSVPGSIQPPSVVPTEAPQLR